MPKVALPHQSILGPLPLHREAKGRNLRTKSMNNQSLKFLHFFILEKEWGVFFMYMSV